MSDDGSSGFNMTAIMSVLAGVGLIGGAGFGGLEWNDAQVEAEREKNSLLVSERDSMRDLHDKQMDKLTAQCQIDKQRLSDKNDAVVSQCTEAGLLQGGVIE